MIEHFADAVGMIAELQPDEPVYCLRTQVLREQAARFVEAFPGDVLYAVKCNDDPRVLQALFDGGIRHFDVASPAETARIRRYFGDVGCHYMHPVKNRRAIAEAYHGHGVRTFALDHDNELTKLMAETGQARDLELLVRLQAPANQAVCDLSGKFGATVPEAARLLAAAAATGNRVGLTFHVGSQCLRPKAYRAAIGLAGQVIGRAGVAIDVLDVGGGFPSRYVDVHVPSLREFIDVIADSAAEIDLPRGCRLQCEPGRALVAEGLSVVARIEARHGRALYLNDGLYGSLSEMRCPGIVLPMRALRPDGPIGGPIGSFSLFGPTCDSIDSMPGPFWLPEEVAEGDWIEIGQLGAYSTVLRTRFNGFYPDRFVEVADRPLLAAAEGRGPGLSLEAA